MQNRQRTYIWMVIGIVVCAFGLGFLSQGPFGTAKAQEQKRFQYKIVEVLPDTQNMQTTLNEFGANGWELAAVSMGNMTEPRLIFKK